MAALAVAMLGLLPAEHVHARGDDTIVHRHVITGGSAHHDDAARHHDTRLDHDDHLAARMLSLAYDTSAPFSLNCSLAVAILSDDETDPATLRQFNRTTLLPTHDPPLRFVSSPAPPASA